MCVLNCKGIYTYITRNVQLKLIYEKCTCRNEKCKILRYFHRKLLADTGSRILLADLGSCSHKVFLPNRKNRNLLGSMVYKGILCAQILQSSSFFTIWWTLLRFSRIFGQEINFKSITLKSGFNLHEILVVVI